jgi:polyphosphate kinase 2 (PPK2 family)
MKPSDIQERRFWKQYRSAYEECLATTSAEAAPWYIVPADDKLSARLFVSHIILETLESLNMGFPKVSAERQKELRAMRNELAAE